MRCCTQHKHVPMEKCKYNQWKTQKQATVADTVKLAHSALIFLLHSILLSSAAEAAQLNSLFKFLISVKADIFFITVVYNKISSGKISLPKN